jgi:hypothetical protein
MQFSVDQQEKSVKTKLKIDATPLGGEEKFAALAADCIEWAL